MTAAYCTMPHCGEPLPDHGTLCYGCTAKLISALKSIPELMDDLAVTFTKRSRTPEPGGPIGVPEIDPVRMPYNIGASKVRAELTGILIAWVLLVSQERVVTDVTRDGDGNEVMVKHPTPVTCESTATSLSGWLLQYTGWIRHYEAGADCVIEVREAVDDVRRLIDSPPPRIYLGPCMAAVQADGMPSRTCVADLWALAGSDDVTCRDCGTAHAVRERQDKNLEAARDVVAYRETVATALTANGRYLTGDLIRKWHTRGLLKVAGHGSTGRKMYRLGDVKDLWDKMNEGRR